MAESNGINNTIYDAVSNALENKINNCNTLLPSTTGKSTYDLAVDYGYVGTEREWLNHALNDTELLNNLRKGATDLAAYIDTIPSAVNDAINNTAVEGGVLADTFVTVTANGLGGVARTQRDKNADNVNIKDFGATGLGTVDETASINKAISYGKATGAKIEWADGAYKSNGNLLNFHDVEHKGSAIIKKGTLSFYISVPEGKINNLFVSTTGLDTNDGMSEATAFKTIQKAFDVIAKIGGHNYSKGYFTVNVGAGTFAKATFGASVPFKTVRVTGALELINAGATDPTYARKSIIDGEGSVSNIGLYLRGGNDYQVDNMIVKNFLGTNGQGISSDRGSSLYTNNCEVRDVGWAGINCNDRGLLQVKGGLVEDCRYGIRAYSNTTFTIGYASIDDRTKINRCTTGVHVQNSSLGHIDYTNITNCVFGSVVENLSRSHFSSVSIDSCRIGISANQLSTFIESAGTTITNSVVKDRELLGFSTEYGKRFLDIDSNANKAVFNKDLSAIPSASYDSYVFEAFDANYFSIQGTNLARLTLRSTGDNHIAIQNKVGTAQFLLTGALTYIMDKTNFRAALDNTISIGNASSKFTTAYLSTAPIVTSDERLKTEFTDPGAAEKRAAIKIKKTIKRYRFTVAIDSKDEKARYHFGVGAQTVADIMREEGLDPEQYAFYCYDEWEATEEIEAGSRYGIRYDELAMFILSVI